MAKVKSKARKQRMLNLGAELKGGIGAIKGRYNQSLDKLNNLNIDNLGPNFNWKDQVNGMKGSMKSEIQTTLISTLNKYLDIPEKARTNPKERSQYMMYLREMTKELPEDVAMDFLEQEIKEATDPTVREGIHKYIGLLGKDPNVSAIGQNRLEEIKRKNMTDEEIEFEMAERMQGTFVDLVQAIDKYIDSDLEGFANPRIGVEDMTENYINGTIENTLKDFGTVYNIEE